MRGATNSRFLRTRNCKISIHAPRAGSDRRQPGDYFILSSNFNPRSPCGERLGPQLCHALHQHFNPRSPCGERRAVYSVALLIRKFQSTLPVRGATWHQKRINLEQQISIHAPRAGSDEYADSDLDKRMTISIHAPRAGSDFGERATALRPYKFQSTLPVRGATEQGGYRSAADGGFQSTLPVRGATTSRRRKYAQYAYFNPRSPCGERR